MSCAHLLPSILLTTSTVALSFAAPALAQAEPADVAAETGAQNDNEIMVTARRRQERAQDVSISLSTVDDRTLLRTGYSNLTQVATLTPSLNIRGSNARNTYLNIRGLGSNSTQNDGLEIGVGVYVDDVYYGRVGSSQFDLIDLERVEVRRGPQGTLFGKNTTAGRSTSRPAIPASRRSSVVKYRSGKMAIDNYAPAAARQSFPTFSPCV